MSQNRLEEHLTELSEEALATWLGPQAPFVLCGFVRVGLMMVRAYNRMFGSWFQSAGLGIRNWLKFGGMGMEDMFW